ncbi:KIR-like protein, partial [Plasmodium coatneyi]
SPSRNMSESNGNKGLYCNSPQGLLDSWKQQVEEKIREQFPKEKNSADDVPPVWCCLSSIFDRSRDEHGPCHLIYYTVGSIIYPKLKEKVSFDKIMKEVHDILGKALSNQKCKGVPGGTVEKLFELMKNRFPYTFTPGEIWKTSGNSKEVHCEGCTNYLRKLAEACKKVEKYCDNLMNSGECNGIARGQDQGSPEYLLQLIESLVLEPQSAEITKNEQQILKEADLRKLPSSKEFYNKFMERTDYCNDRTSALGVKSELKNNENIENSVEYIVEPLCYIAKMEYTHPLYTERCNFLYFWIGSLLPDNFQGSLFLNLINNIYIALQGLNVTDRCGLMYDNNISRSLFKQRRKIHDFTHDYEAIRAQLQRSGRRCDETYKKHLEDIKSAYKAVHEDCKDKPNDEYCVKFTSKYGEYSKQRELKFESKSECISPSTSGIRGESCSLGKETPKGTQIYKDVLLEFTPISTAHQGSYTNTSTMEENIITTTISSLLGYTPLSSWVRNSSRSRKKRTINYEFDTLTTEDHDTLTEYSQDNSSTIGFTEDNSTIYSEPSARPHPIGRQSPSSTRRGRANNNKNQQRRKNISYQNM